VAAITLKKMIYDIVGFALPLMKMIHQLLGCSHVIVEEPQSGYVSEEKFSSTSYAFF
jgi:hypothetical protein